ncbi:MAG: hypothetical protein MI746_14150, partial [Pseudomonadales bacterium]|nr:hypothetical protein [Pseudomonadales bacterium]
MTKSNNHKSISAALVQVFNPQIAVRFTTVVTVLFGSIVSAQQDSQQNTLRPDYPNNYTMYDDVIQMPEGRALGSLNAIDVDSRGNVWVFERCGGNQGACPESDVDP